MVCGHPPPLRLSDADELETLAPPAFATPLGLHPDLHPSTYSVRTGDRLLFFTDGLLEARDRAGRFFRLDEHIQTLRRPGLQSAADELLDRLRAHTRHRLDDDIAVLLIELTLAESAGKTPEERPWPAARAGWPAGDHRVSRSSSQAGRLRPPSG
jgi:sigma-B regulation protein RsbU (phosphoserine phosphatase)